MPYITTCLKCGKLYEESSEEEANNPDRKCLSCFHGKPENNPEQKEIMSKELLQLAKESDAFKAWEKTVHGNLDDYKGRLAAMVAFSEGVKFGMQESKSFPSLTLRKVEEKELRDGQEYLTKYKDNFRIGQWLPRSQEFTDDEYYWPIAHVTAIYELPQ